MAEKNKYEIHKSPENPAGSSPEAHRPSSKRPGHKVSRLAALVYILGLGAVSMALYQTVFAHTVSDTAPVTSERILAAVNGEPAQLKKQASQDPMASASQQESQPADENSQDQEASGSDGSGQDPDSQTSSGTDSQESSSDESVSSESTDSESAGSDQSNAVFGFPIIPQSDQAVVKTILIDAGHGGKDSGDAASDGTMEKDITLDLARKIRDQLALQNPNLNVVMVRDTDTGSPQGSGWEDLVWRRNIQDETNADYFLSIHAHGQDENPGMTWFVNPDDYAAQSLAQKAQANLASMGWNDPSDMVTTDTYPLQLISMANSHALQFELGSLKNASDLSAMKDEEKMNKAAAAIAAAINETIQENPNA